MDSSGSWTDEETDSLEEQKINKGCKTTIKSSKISMADSSMMKYITWPDKLMYLTGFQPTVYEDLTLPIFFSEYMAILEMVKPTQRRPC